MSIPRRSGALEDCLTCQAREERFFCNCSADALQRLNEIRATAFYPKRSLLFMEGQRPRGVFVLCGGHAKLFTSSLSGKIIITEILEAGDVAGLHAVISNRPYEVTAEMMEDGKANFIPRESLLQLQKDHNEVAVLIAEQLSRDYYAANDEIRLLGLSRSPAAKFALLLLSWWDKTGEGNRIAQVKLTLSHQEIADILGTTRETISHLFAKFERKHLVERVGRTLVIRNRQVLEWISLT